MALNKEVFKTRSLTAVVFVIVMLLGLFWNWWSFVVLFTIIHFGCWYEYLKLVEKIYKASINSIVKHLFAFSGFVLAYNFGITHFWHDMFINVGIHISLKLVLFLLLAMSLYLLFIKDKNIPAVAKWVSIAGIIYITIPIAAMFNFRDSFVLNHGFSTTKIPVLACGIIFSIWINDTMAYVVGSLIGKTPFSKISPKKTWEGTAGGAILCVIVIGLLGMFIPVAKQIAPIHWLIIAAICAIFGTAGDLLESKIKRLANVKDSGSFMPGHGGFLDRFDSLLVATPFVWLYVWLFV